MTAGPLIKVKSLQRFLSTRYTTGEKRKKMLMMQTQSSLNLTLWMKCLPNLLDFVHISIQERDLTVWPTKKQKKKTWTWTKTSVCHIQSRAAGFLSASRADQQQPGGSCWRKGWRLVHITAPWRAEMCRGVQLNSCRSQLGVKQKHTNKSHQCCSFLCKNHPVQIKLLLLQRPWSSL